MNIINELNCCLFFRCPFNLFVFLFTSTLVFCSDESLSPITISTPDDVTLRLLTYSDISSSISSRITEFKLKTGITVNLTTEPTLVELYNSALNDSKSLGVGYYDGYIISSNWLLDFAQNNILPLSQYVANDSDLNWNDVFPFHRQYTSTFNKQILGIPVSGNLLYLYYRTDILAQYRLTYPTTWDEFYTLAYFLNHRDLNFDGITDYGFCIPTALEGVAPYIFYSILGPMMQTQGTSQGIFFDVQTFDPLIENPAFLQALGYWQEFVSLGPSALEFGATLKQSRQLFLSGRCGFMIDWGELSLLAKGSFVQYRLGVAPAPGATQVLNRSTGLMISCDVNSCPYATIPNSSISGTLVNFAPYAASGGWLGVVSGSSLSPNYPTSLYSFFSFLSQTNQSQVDAASATSNFSPYRYSHMNTNPNWNQYRFGFYDNYIDPYLEYTLDSMISSNIILDLRIPGSTRYIFDSLDQELSKFILQNLTAQQVMSTVKQSWISITDQLGQNYQLENYQLSLGSQPLNSANQTSNHAANAAAIAVPTVMGSLILLLLLLALLSLLIAGLIISRIRRKGRNKGYKIDYKSLEIKERIGVGSYGEVSKAIFRGTEVAVKTLFTKDLDEEIIKEFVAETAIMYELRHPNVVLFMGACFDEPKCIVTELMPRGSLYDVLHDEGIILDWKMIKNMALDAAKGMNFLHSATPALLHCDLKSLNLLVDDKWNLKVADFGLTQLKTKTNARRMGSILWTAPEVLSEGNFSEKSDVYSFGIVLWEIITRQTPYDGLNQMRVALGVMTGLRPEIPPNLHEDLVRLIQNCWASDPNDRPSFVMIRQILENIEFPLVQDELGNFNSDGNFSVSLRTTMNNASRFQLQQQHGHLACRPPTGTSVTFLFTDICGHNSIWDKLPNEMKEATSLHNSLLRQIITDNAGYEVKSERNSFMIAFPSATFAVKAAISFQESLMLASWPKRILYHPSAREERDRFGNILMKGLRVRMGINTGDAYCTTDIVSGRADYFGNAVDRAAQITGLALEGQILITEHTKNEIMNDLEDLLDSPIILETNFSVGKQKRRIYQILPTTLKNRFSFFKYLGEQEKSSVSNCTIPPVDASLEIEDEADSRLQPSSNSPFQDQQQQQQQQEEEEQGLDHEDHQRLSSHFPAGHLSSEVRWIIPYQELSFIRKIGMGSFGDVFKGKWRESNVAIKVLHRQQANDKLLFELRKESAIMSTLRHPNVLLFMGACIEPPNLCIVTEYMKRGSLSQILREKSSNLSWLTRLRMARETAIGMAYLHGMNPPLIHRDLTSFNILVDKKYNLKIGDFGLSRIKASNAMMTRCGTAAWTAPEILAGLEYSEKTDLYSFGIILWELLTRKRPYKNKDPIKIAQLVAQGARPKVPDGCPAEYATLIKQCWQTDPDLRPTFQEVAQHLQVLESNARAYWPVEEEEEEQEKVVAEDSRLLSSSSSS